MKFFIVIIVFIAVSVSTAPPASHIQEVQSDSPDNQQGTDHRPGQQILSHFGELLSAPLILVMLLTYPIACGMKEGGCRRNLQSNDTSQFNVTRFDGDLEEVVKQIQKDEDIDVTDNDEYKPLYALEKGNKKIVKILIDNGKNMSSQNNDEKSSEHQDGEERLKIILKTVSSRKRGIRRQLLRQPHG